MLTLIDIIILLLLFAFAFSGFVFGFIRSFGSLLATLAGIYLAAHYYQLISENLFQPVFKTIPESVSCVLSFILIFLLVDIIISLFFYLLDRLIKLISFLPFLRAINRVGGAIFGLLKGGFFIGIIIYILTKYPLSPFISQSLEGSKIVPLFLRIIKLISPLLPVALKQIKSILSN